MCILKSSHLDRADHLSVGIEHALPDPGQIPQIEDVVELGRSWKHLDLGQLPETAGQRHQAGYGAPNLMGETATCTEVALTNHTYSILLDRW